MKVLLTMVNGSSMNNVIANGDLVLLKKRTKIKTGDVFAYKQNGNYIVHRALFVGMGYVWEIGDNNYRINKVKKDEILAKVIANITQQKDLDNPKLNKRIRNVNLIRYLFHKRFRSTKELMKKKGAKRIFVNIIKKRNDLQEQYSNMGGEWG